MPTGLALMILDDELDHDPKIKIGLIPVAMKPLALNALGPVNLTMGKMPLMPDLE